MIAVTSTTDNSNYDFFLPIIHFCWRKLGIDTLFIIPLRIKNTKRMEVIYRYTQGAFYQTFKAPGDKEITYAQVARLFAAAAGDDEVYVTTDADMAVFNNVFDMSPAHFNILGADLVPTKQYPICYAYASGAMWREAFKMGDKTMQELLDEDLGGVECEHFSGNYWSHDQDLLYKALAFYQPVAWANRAYPGTQFASKRIDRADGMWETMMKSDTIDFHMFRPGYTPDNFTKIMRVLRFFYPQEDFTWLINYRNEYLEA